MSVPDIVTGYSFKPEDLRVAERLPGVSAFMRIRNGEDFLEASIRTHIDAFDEIVAVYNQCTDTTADILARLAQEYGPKLRVFHYIDRVYPPGSSEHTTEPASSPNSLVNYYNFALSRTRFTYVTKLDDDHLAIENSLHDMCKRVRHAMSGSDSDRMMYCFSGLNLARNEQGDFAVPSTAVIAGTGDHWFFRVRESTYFLHDPRYERLDRTGLKRIFCGFAYWHLKYLKQGEGFANYELESNPGSRYTRQMSRFRASPTLDLPQLRQFIRPSVKDRLFAAISEKRRLVMDARLAVPATFAQSSLEAALDATSPGWRNWLNKP